MDSDQDQLRLLSIFHYVVGGMMGLFSCFPCIYVFFGIAMLSGAFPKQANQPDPPEAFAWIVIGIGGFMMLLGWTLALAIILTGRFLGRHVYYTWCLVVAAIECLFMPFGTVLGVFTIIVLLRPSVKTLFQSQAESSAGGNPWAG